MPVAPPLRHTLHGRHLVVTGATGFVGKVWLSHLLHTVPGIGRVTLLVRPPRKGTAADRMAALFDDHPVFRPLREHHDRDYAAFLAERIEVVDADLSAPRCGLDEATVDRLADTADAVVHLAGLTDFHPDPRDGLPANVHGTAHVADLAERLRVPRMLHVSTCYVAGTADGPVPEQLEPGVSPNGTPFDVDAVIAEVEEAIGAHRHGPDRTDAAGAIAARLGWPNNYTFTKGLAEHLLARRDLALTIVRPSVVECARTYPMPGWNEGVNTSAPIMWFCGTAFLDLPSTGEHRFDIVPVDAVARWTTVVLARLLRGEARRVHQLASSDVNPTTFDRIVELTALGHRRAARRGHVGLLDQLPAWLDIAPRRRDATARPFPEDLAALAADGVEALDAVDPKRRFTGRWAWVGERLRPRWKQARRAVVRQRRDLQRLQSMLDVYRPFIHDHDWIFSTANTRDAVAHLHPEDRAEFGDDLTDLCWRDYWLDVQFPGMERWAFPLIRGEDVPIDPPAAPRVQLDPASLAPLEAGDDTREEVA